MAPDATQLLEQGEQVDEAVRPSRLHFPFLRFYLAAVMIAAVIGGILFLVDPAAYRAYIPVAPSALPLLFALPALLIAYIELHHYFIVYHFTDRKVIEQRGILNQSVMTIPYSHITETYMTTTLLQRLFGIGDLHLNTAGRDATELVIKGVRNPQQYKLMVESRGSGKNHQTIGTMTGSSEDVTEVLEAELGRVHRERQRLEQEYAAEELADEEYEQQWYVLQGEERILLNLLDKVDAD